MGKLETGEGVPASLFELCRAQRVSVRLGLAGRTAEDAERRRNGEAIATKSTERHKDWGRYRSKAVLFFGGLLYGAGTWGRGLMSEQNIQTPRKALNKAYLEEPNPAADIQSLETQIDHDRRWQGYRVAGDPRTPDD